MGEEQRCHVSGGPAHVATKARRNPVSPHAPNPLTFSTASGLFFRLMMSCGGRIQRSGWHS